MIDYSGPEYKNLYEEILKDYNWTWGKFSPIQYPTHLHIPHHESQRTNQIARTSNQSTRAN